MADSKKKNIKPLIILIAVIILGILAGVGIRLLKGSQSAPEPVTDEPTSKQSWDSETENDIPVVDGKGFIGYDDTVKIDVKQVRFKDGVKSVDAHAFEGCAFLESIEIPDTVTSIGDYAFCKCGIKEIIIPESVTSIGKHAFDECALLAVVKLPSKLLILDESAFSNCLALKEIEIPEEVNIVGASAFAGCPLEKIVLHDGLERISNNAFYSACVTELTVPDTVESIGDTAFMDCRYLETVKMSANVQTIGMHTFANCSKLSQIDIPDGAEVDGDAFVNCPLLEKE